LTLGEASSGLNSKVDNRHSQIGGWGCGGVFPSHDGGVWGRDLEHSGKI